MSSQGAIFPCESLAILYTFIINIVAVTVPFLTAVSSKLFIPQPLIFAFCASNSPLLPATGKETGEESSTWLENLSRGTDFQSTIPTPQHQV